MARMPRGGVSRIALTKAQKLRVCKKSAEEPTWSSVTLAAWAQHQFQFAKAPGDSTIRKILKQKTLLLQLSVEDLSRKRAMAATVKHFDQHVIQALALFEGKVHLPGRVIIGLAKIAAEILGLSAHRLRLTRSGWLRHFLARYGMGRRRSHGEAGSVDPEVVAAAVKRLREKIAQYHPSDVFNMDEAAYFFKSLPQTSICFKYAPSLKGNKARLTIVVCTNASGTEKLPLTVLGKTKKPRWLPDKPENVRYIGTSKGWMTVSVFQQWLSELNDEMVLANRKILILFDNAPVHIEPEVPLSNVEVQRLPKNTTAVLQPMDQGVISLVKRDVMATRADNVVYNLLVGEKNPYNVQTADAVT